MNSYLKRTQQALVHTHHCPSIVEFPAVIWCTKESDQLSLGEEFVPVLHNLMCSANQVHVMLLEETRNNVRPKSEGNTTVILAPPSDVLVRIRPEQVTEEAAVRNLVASASSARPLKSVELLRQSCRGGLTYIRGTHNTPYLLHGVEIWTQPAMHGEDLLVDDCCNG